MSSDYNAFLKRNLEKVLSKFGRVALKNKVEKTDLTSALQTEINSKASTSDLNSVASSVSTVSTGLSAVDTKVNTLIGDDQNKSARTIADEEVAKVIADAPASFDTLKEIADWISNHADDAAQMNSDIIALKAKTVLGTYIPEGEVDPVEYATVKAYVEAYVAEHAPTDAQRLVDANGTALNAGSLSVPVYFNNGVPVSSSVSSFKPTFLSDDVADDDVTTSTGWGVVTKLTSGSSLSALFNKISQMFRNIRWLYKMLGETDISTIGNGTITGAISSLNTSLPKFVDIQVSSTTESVSVPYSNMSALKTLYSVPFPTGLVIKSVSVTCNNAWVYLAAEINTARRQITVTGRTLVSSSSATIDLSQTYIRIWYEWVL